MKHSIIVKFLAIALCALSLVAVAGAGLGILVATEQGLYSQTPEEVLAEQQESIGMNIADRYAKQYARENLGNLTPELLGQFYDYYANDYYEVNFDFVLELYQNGECIYTYTSDEPEEKVLYEYTIVPTYAVAQEQSSYWCDDYGNEYAATVPFQEGTEEVTSDVTVKDLGEPLYTETREITSYDNDGNPWCTEYLLYYYNAPEYQVKIYLDKEASYNGIITVLEPLYQYRYHLIGLAVLGLLVFAVTLVYLCCAAGRKPGTDEIRPAALNRMPLDLYAVAACIGCGLLIWGGFEIVRWIFGYDENWALLSLAALCAYGAALLAIGFVYAFAAQVKSKGGYWWRHMILGWCLSLVGRFFRWIGRGLKWCARGCRAVFNLLPVIWQWLLTAVLMVFAVLFSLFLCMVGGSGLAFIGFFLLLASIIMCVVTICYGGYCFGTLLKGAKAMAQGNLDRKIPTKHLYGSFKDFGNQLNNLAEGAKIAAERQMKSERMKTELITNVSHDIKTPLTSIINYVDLMKKPHSNGENEQYLDVLDRQSQRLKKLIDDLMEMSKASTGNLTVELTQVDAVEAVNQALGEFADKLSSVNLTPVFRHPEAPVIMRADGRLVWRVLSNLLSNAYKYALPDTRLYIDLMVLQGNAVIAIKNISREQLNVGADELMERFVRGDTSRNTEGSGLGLNIAKSLVELQHGQMHLMVDGDLFKATLIFPLA